MKIKLILLLGVLLLLLAGGVSAKPISCTVMLPATERDAAISVINKLMGAAMRTGDYMPDLALLQEGQRVMTVLNNAPTVGCDITQ